MFDVWEKFYASSAGKDSVLKMHDRHQREKKEDSRYLFDGGSELSYQLEFTIEALPKIISNGSQGSWRVKAGNAAKWKKMVWARAYPSRPLKPLEIASLTLTRASSVEPDYDNLVISMKCVVDALVHAGILSNDRMENIGIPNYRWEKAAPKRGFIRVKVEGVE